MIAADKSWRMTWRNKDNREITSIIVTSLMEKPLAAGKAEVSWLHSHDLRAAFNNSVCLQWEDGVFIWCRWHGSFMYLLYVCMYACMCACMYVCTYVWCIDWPHNSCMATVYLDFRIYVIWIYVDSVNVGVALMRIALWQNWLSKVTQLHIRVHLVKTYQYACMYVLHVCMYFIIPVVL